MLDIFIYGLGETHFAFVLTTFNKRIKLNVVNNLTLKYIAGGVAVNPELFDRYLDKLDEMMPYVVRRLHQELAQSLEEGITGNQFFVMKMINDRGQMTVSEVAEEFNVSLSAVTSLVDRLHKTGMVERRRSEDDRRVVWLELTERGRNIVGACLESRRRILRRYLDKLDEKELEFMIEVNEKIISMMRQEEKGQVSDKT